MLNVLIGTLDRCRYVPFRWNLLLMFTVLRPAFTYVQAVMPITNSKHTISNLSTNAVVGWQNIKLQLEFRKLWFFFKIDIIETNLQGDVIIFPFLKQYKLRTFASVPSNKLRIFMRKFSIVKIFFWFSMQFHYFSSILYLLIYICLRGSHSNNLEVRFENLYDYSHRNSSNFSCHSNVLLYLTTLQVYIPTYSNKEQR